MAMKGACLHEPGALNKEIERLSKELRLSGELTDSRLIELKVDIDRIKFDIAVLKRFLEQSSHSLRQDFSEIREKIVQEVNPEIG